MWQGLTCYEHATNLPPSHPVGIPQEWCIEPFDRRLQKTKIEYTVKRTDYFLQLCALIKSIRKLFLLHLYYQ